jgi:nucleotide-binding universal stress UspA family protein
LWDLTSILAATDTTPGGRHAVRTATWLAEARRAALTVLTVLPASETGTESAGSQLVGRCAEPAGAAPIRALRNWLDKDEPRALPGGAELVVGFGVPGIEISRLARRRSADLIIMGRRPRGPRHPLQLGETADVLVRRSDIPIVFVPPQVERFRSALVALDGSTRSHHVLEVGLAVSGALGAVDVRAVTVEPPRPDEPNTVAAQPTGRSRGLERLLDGLGETHTATRSISLAVRCGSVVAEVLAEVEHRGADLLVIGYRRGGPPRFVEPTEIARNLLYSAPSAILTVPL